MDKKKEKTIDATPTWEGLWPMYAHVIQSGDEQQRKNVIPEIHRLFTIADNYNRLIRAVNKVNKEFDNGNDSTQAFNELNEVLEENYKRLKEHNKNL